MNKGFDPKCLDLAEHFMAGDIELGDEFSAEALAQEIQNAVEEWFERRHSIFARQPLTGTWESPPFAFERAASLRGPAPKGQWRPIAKQDGRTAAIGCPTCGFESLLVNHTVAPNGHVDGPVQCPADISHHFSTTLCGW